MKIKKIISSALALCLFFTMVTISPKTALASESNVDVKEIFSDENVESIMPFLEIVDKIPMSFLEEGDSNKINNYFIENGLGIRAYNPEKGETIRVKRGNVLRCGLAIGQLIVTVGLPISQITKIKKYIAALGGIKETALLLTGATTASEKLQGALTALAGVLASVTGVADIQEHCFG